MEIVVEPPGLVEWEGRRWRCALGRGGVSRDKREGDRATPVGSFPIRRILYRPERILLPRCDLAVAPIARDAGWCDDAADPAYNRQVRLPYPASCERLWRKDRIYDLIAVLGYNDEPAVAGRGSAIFLHLARGDFSPTQGCIAVERGVLLAIVAGLDAASRLRVRG